MSTKGNKWLGFAGTLLACAIMIALRRYSFDPCGRCNTHWGVREYMVMTTLQTGPKVSYPFTATPIRVPTKLCYSCAEKMKREAKSVVSDY